MTITINLPPATLDQLKAEAQATGKDVETVVREAVEAKMALSQMSLQEVLRPLNEAIAASGMTPEEAESFFEQELSAMRAERKSSLGKK
jgi:predicted transcriptional regulator